MVIPATKVRSEFTKILPRIIGDNYFTLTYKGYPKYALVDLKYLEDLESRKLFEKATAETSSMFAKYLKSIGKNINTISEKEANAILNKLAGLD
jgi:hypothetical protein